MIKHSGLLASLLFAGLVSASAMAADASISKGHYLAQAGDCAACHTAAGDANFAGGLKMLTPVGAIYSTNITPDKQTGIGDYTYILNSESVVAAVTFISLSPEQVAV